MDRSFNAPLRKFAVSQQAAVIADADVLFTVTGPIRVVGLFSLCISANDATASTLKYKAYPTIGTAADISGASASLASAAAGATVVAQGAALSTAPVVNAGGPGLAPSMGLLVPAGTIKAVVGVGSTTGTWKHFLAYEPLAAGAVAY